MADGSLSLESAFMIERAEFHARLLGLRGPDAQRFVEATQAFHAGQIDTDQLMEAMEKTDEHC